MKKSNGFDVIFFFSTLLLFLLFFGHQESIAQDIRFMGGVIQEEGSRERSYAWSLQYLHDLNERWTMSFSWINEGHFEHHHRDGHTFQLWARTAPLWNKVVLSAGIGPYRYYDTELASDGISYADSHGWGLVGSFSVTWTPDRHWLFFLQSNLIETSRSIDTVSMMAGIGYHLDEPARSADLSATKSKIINEFDILGGFAIVNSRDSENDIAFMLEYRRRLGDHFDWTVGFLNEGNPGPIKRNGMLTQLWLVQRFFQDRFGIGVAGGPYIPLDARRNYESGGKDDPFLAGMIALGVAYDFLPRWTVRFSWNRIVTDYDRDTDVLLGGIGFCF